MQFHRDPDSEQFLIKAFGADGVLVGDKTLCQSCIISPDTMIESWPVKTLATLTTSDLLTAIELQTELILLGTGSRLIFPAPQITEFVTKRGIGFEIMDTAAACRTYNVLVHEGRAVAAAVIIDSRA